jgi:Coenzyme PQQ synthesis protein D (PqqD)
MAVTLLVEIDEHPPAFVADRWRWSARVPAANMNSSDHVMSAVECETETAPRLAAGGAIHYDRETGRHVLTHGGQTVLLNKMAVFILRLCDGSNSRRDILLRMRTGTGSPLAMDVHAFLDAATELKWITENPRVSPIAAVRHH